MVNTFSFDISLSSFFWGGKRPEENVFLVNNNFRSPSVVLLPNSYETAATLGFADVLVVYLLRNIAQVAESIVGRVSVNMVYGVFWPTSCHVQPSQPMGEVDFPLNGNSKSLCRSFAANDVTHFANLSDNGFSGKDTGAGVVMDKIAQTFGSQRFMNHLRHRLMRVVEIGDAVITSNAIYAPELFWRKLPVNIKPSQGRGVVGFTVHEDGNASITPLAPRCTSSQGHAAPDAPRKNPGIRIVMKKLFESFLGKGRIANSHDALQKLIGQRPGRADNTLRPCHYITLGVA